MTYWWTTTTTKRGKFTIKKTRWLSEKFPHFVQVYTTDKGGIQIGYQVEIDNYLASPTKGSFIPKGYADVINVRIERLDQTIPTKQFQIKLKKLPSPSGFTAAMNRAARQGIDEAIKLYKKNYK